MNETVSAITDDLRLAMERMADRMLKEGATETDVRRAVENYIGMRRRKTYRKPPMDSVGSIMRKSGILDQLERNKASAQSTSERVLYDRLVLAGIKFKFQYQIGPYTADFVIGSLVVELDGPYHGKRQDKDARRDLYMRLLGYTIMRIPVGVFAVEPDKVIQAIRQNS